ncbi:MAG: rhodanese-like domain-containing protein [Fusobacterium sp.]|nr:rhodanese-like domain-containing protein [Fusobacterium sp.]
MTNLAYKRISQEEAKEMIDSLKDCLILDVRTGREYASGHIPNAINIPNEDIGYFDPLNLKDKNKPILVYCRSGHRSLQSAAKLSLMGYTNVYEFGGIITWKYDITEPEVIK